MRCPICCGSINDGEVQMHTRNNHLPTCGIASRNPGCRRGQRIVFARLTRYNAAARALPRHTLTACSQCRWMRTACQLGDAPHHRPPWCSLRRVRAKGVPRLARMATPGDSGYGFSIAFHIWAAAWTCIMCRAHVLARASAALHAAQPLLLLSHVFRVMLLQAAQAANEEFYHQRLLLR